MTVFSTLFVATRTRPVVVPKSVAHEEEEEEDEKKKKKKKTKTKTKTEGTTMEHGSSKNEGSREGQAAPDLCGVTVHVFPTDDADHAETPRVCSGRARLN